MSTIARETRSPARMETGEGPRATVGEAVSLHRRARACPSSSQAGAGFTRLARLARLEQKTVVRERLLPNGAWREEPLPGPYRRAGACPPRSLDLRENRTPTKAVFRSNRGTARDRPSPYGDREAALQTVARGPVPRDRSIRVKNARRPKPFPRPRHGEGQALALRLTETALHTVSRGPVPRDRSTRAKTERQPRPFSSRSRHGGGQAPALR